MHLGAKSGCETAQGWLPAEYIRCGTPRRGNAASNADTPAWARRSSNTASRRSEGAQRNRLCNLRSEHSGCAPKLRTAEERSGNDAEKQGPTQYRCLASHHMATCFCALALTRRLKRRTTTHFHMATATSTEEASLDVPVKPSARGRRCKLGLPRAKAAKLSRESPDTSRVKTPRRDAKGTYKYRPRRSGRPPKSQPNSPESCHSTWRVPGPSLTPELVPDHISVPTRTVWACKWQPHAHKAALDAESGQCMQQNRSECAGMPWLGQLSSTAAGLGKPRHAAHNTGIVKGKGPAYNWPRTD